MTMITPQYLTIGKLMQRQSFSIDEYQREYKWDKENVDELVNDLRGKFQNSYRDGDSTTKVKTYDDYFLGSIIVSKRDNTNFLIDGQQRITTLTLLLIYLYRTTKVMDHKVYQSLAPLIFSDNAGENQYNLDIPERIEVIDALFEGKHFDPTGKDESVQNIFARYGDIQNSELADDLADALPHFTYWLLDKVGMIEIATNNDVYAYAIFETMNDRGKSLSPVDMLKAYLLAPIEEREKRRRANQVWKKEVLHLLTLGGEQQPDRDANCIKAWFRAQYAETSRKQKAGSPDRDWELIGSTFHRWMRDNSGRLQVGSQEQNLAFIFEHFPFFSGAYSQILNASRTYTPGLEAVFYNAHNEFTWQNTALLAPLSVTDDVETVRRKIAVTATYLDIWLMRRAVNYIRSGYDSSAYPVFTLCKEIRRKPLPELVEILTKKLETEDDATFEGSPSRGRTGIDGLELNQFSKRYMFHMLARMTAFTEVGARNSDIFDKYVDRKRETPYDIEHIWPDDYKSFKAMFSSPDEFRDWRNHIAGLLLLPATVNRSVQKKPFEQKITKYAEQNFFAKSLTDNAYLNEPQFLRFTEQFGLPFKPYKKFGREEQMERRELLLALANRIWSPDRLKEMLA